MNKNTKNTKGPRTIGKMEGWTYYTATQETWTRGMQPHALCIIMDCDIIINKKWCRRTVRETVDRQKYRETGRNISLTGPHWGPLEPSVVINAYQRWTITLEINTKNTKKACGGPFGWTDRHIILTLIRFKPLAWIRMRCAKLRATKMNFYCPF